jgi:hypothetical protein
MRYVPRMACVECGYRNKREKVPEADVAALLAQWPRRPKEETPRREPGREGGEPKENQQRANSPSPAERRAAFTSIRGGRT